MIRSISPLLYNLGPSYLVNTLIMESTCQRGMCPLTLTSFSWFDVAKFTSASFGDGVSFSISIKLRLSIFCPRRVYVRQTCVTSPLPYFHGLLTILNLHQVFTIRSMVSPLLYFLGSPYMVHM